MKILVVATVVLSIIYTPDKDMKEKAFVILQQKCNVCHRKQNPRMVFTTENMARHARKIKFQVFTLKRMPKGDEITLNETERKILKTWIDERQ
ncbi:hypothetical protein [Pseudochryseolinea flava]|nr:hypothetical protein [Pseudochryseolinea flava]